MTQFRFLHISDLHIAEIPERLGAFDIINAGFRINLKTRVAKASSHSEIILNALAELAWREGPQIEGVLITGDLATTGEQADLEAAYKFIHEPFSKAPYITGGGRPTLANPENLNIYLIPGNHDRYQGPYYMPGGTEFDTVFGGSDWPGGQTVYTLDVLSKGGASLAIVGADMTLRSASDIERPDVRQIWGAGRAYKDIITKLSNITDRIRSQYTPVGIIWLVHFPPKFPHISSSLKLIKQNRLVAAARSKNVNILLTGHTHRSDRYTIPNTTIEVLCAGTATQHLPPYSSDERTVHFLDFIVSPSGDCSVSGQKLTWSDLWAYWI